MLVRARPAWLAPLNRLGKSHPAMGRKLLHRSEMRMGETYTAPAPVHNMEIHPAGLVLDSPMDSNDFHDIFW
jgi:hypothetical protein